MIDTILTVKNEDLDRLSPNEAVDLFRELLWAEATSLRIGIDKINVSSAIYSPDGGIDAQVKDIPKSSGLGIIREGLTSYQIKTGPFNINHKAQIEQIVYKKDTSELKPRVKSCFENDGTLVIVLFGWDGTETEDNQTIHKIVETLRNTDPQYQHPKIVVWQQNQIIGFLKKFPALALRVNNRARSLFDTHQNWASHGDMQTPYFPDPETEKQLLLLRSSLLENSGNAHIRVCGEAGIGKTRFVLEATNTDEIKPLIIYSTANTFRDSELMQLLLREEFYCILVVDDCDPNNATYIWNQISNYTSRVKLITIYNEESDFFSGIQYFEISPLADENIKQILLSYQIPIERVWVWTGECNGSPLVAHVVGWNLKNNPEDKLKPPATVNIWERYITGGDDTNNPDVNQRRTVLRFIALFKRFGFGSPLVEEAKLLWELINQEDNSISWRKFQEIVTQLRKRKILQGENTLFISPKLLHVWLWVEWWENYGNGFTFESIKDLSPRMLDWHFEMYVYAAGSKEAIRQVQQLLGPTGPFISNPETFRADRGAQFFLYLTKADPKSALNCLQKTVGKWSEDQLLVFRTGRRQIISALEEICQYRDLFPDGARLLLKLALAENESYANNASGVFCNLFNITEHAPFAKIESTPEERFQILKEVIESDNKQTRLLGLRAANQALKRIDFGVLSSHPKIFGKQPAPWKPMKTGELFNAYQQVWFYLIDKIDEFEQDEQEEVLEILINNARSLNISTPLSEMIIETFDELSKKEYVRIESLLRQVIEILHYDSQSLPDSIREKWNNLETNLSGPKFSSSLMRYIGMDLIEDQFDKSGQLKATYVKTIEKLAQEGVDNPDKLRPELRWIIKSETRNIFPYGYQVGKKDHEKKLLPEIITIIRINIETANELFLGGYLRALKEDIPEEFESIINEFLEDELLCKFVPALIWRCNALSDTYALMILELVKKGKVSYREFLRFLYGKELHKLSEGVFSEWLDYLLSIDERLAADIALDLFSQYFLRKDQYVPLPENLSLEILQNPRFFDTTQNTGHGDHMAPYHWSQVGNAFLLQYPQHNKILAEITIDHFGEQGTIFGGFHSYTTDVLRNIIASEPEMVWNLISERFDIPLNTNLFYLFQWLRGDDMFSEEKKGAMHLFPQELILEWINEDIESRAPIIASHVPPVLSQTEGQPCFARELLVRYGSREDVRDHLMSNFSNEGWTGPESLHLRGKIERLQEYKAEEKNLIVKEWIDDYIQELQHRQNDAKIREERDYLD